MARLLPWPAGRKHAHAPLTHRFCTHPQAAPHYFLPWTHKPQREGTGSGFAIDGQRILTNAHVVADQTLVTVRKHGSPTKYVARVQHVGHDWCARVRVWVGSRQLSPRVSLGLHGNQLDHGLVCSLATWRC